MIRRLRAGQVSARACPRARRAFPGTDSGDRRRARKPRGGARRKGAWTLLLRPAMFGSWLGLRTAARLLARDRAFVIVAVTTLALGIGVNAAMFSVIRAVLLRPLPFPAPDRIVTLGERDRDGTASRTSFATVSDLVARSRTVQVAAMRYWTPTLSGQGPATTLEGLRVSASYFDVLGARPFLGRHFTADEDRPEAERVVILGHGIWRRRFGGDPAVVGRLVTLSGLPHRVVGVLPASF